MTDISLAPAHNDDDERTHESGLFRGLRYPLGRQLPSPHTLIALAPGVLWFRMALPMSLDHINLYILDDGAGWALVDTGMNSESCREQWEALFAGMLADRPITRVIVTHYHPDHLGLAGWLCARFQVELWIARTEFLLARTLTLDNRPAPPEDAITFFAQAGWSEQALDVLRNTPWGFFSKAVAELPVGFRRIQANDVLLIGGRQWRIIIGRGHAPEHVCLICDEDQLMISGDQVLPRITSNVSVYPTEPMANPLKDWLDSLNMLRRESDGLFVFPAHNEPFYNLHHRCNQLTDDHMGKLARLTEFVHEPKTALECFESLFRRPIRPREMGMATGEALAHLRYLEETGAVLRLTDQPAHRFVAT